jgi:hypothetical protein
MATATVTIPGQLFWSSPADDQSPFEREKAAFHLQLPKLQKYKGQFVAIHGGQVVDADRNRNALVRRYFEKYGKGTGVYVGFVGIRPTARIATPFVTRH